MGRTRKTRKDLPQRVYERRGAYFFVDRSGKWHPLGKSYGEAMRTWASLLGEQRTAQTIGHLMDRYILEIIPEKAVRTQKDYLAAIKNLRPVFGCMAPEDLLPKHIYQYMHQRNAKVRANREKATLSSVMQYGVSIGAINSNPCKSVKRFTERPRQRYAEDTELEAFLPHCPPWLQLYVRLKMLTGLRQGDMLNLRLDAIRPDGLYVETGKTGRAILFEWSDDLRQVLNDIRGLHRRVSSLHFFPSRNMSPFTESGFQSAWQRAMTSAVAAGSLKSSFRENDLRAKVATDAHAQGQNATDLLGHESPQTTRRNYIRGALKVEPLRKKNIGQNP